MQAREIEKEKNERRKKKQSREESRKCRPHLRLRLRERERGEPTVVVEKGEGAPGGEARGSATVEAGCLSLCHQL